MKGKFIGSSNPNWGKKCITSYETKQKISAKRKGVPNPKASENNHKRPVILHTYKEKCKNAKYEWVLKQPDGSIIRIPLIMDICHMLGVSRNGFIYYLGRGPIPRGPAAGWEVISRHPLK